MFFSSVPPTIEGSHKPQDRSVVIRQPIRLECKPSGVPEPNITWHKDGEELHLVEARHIRLLHNDHVLQIMGAKVEDAGSYTCTARNEAGHDQKLYKLQVYGQSTGIFNTLQYNTIQYNTIQHKIFYSICYFLYNFFFFIKRDL